MYRMYDNVGPMKKTWIWNMLYVATHLPTLLDVNFLAKILQWGHENVICYAYSYIIAMLTHSDQSEVDDHSSDTQQLLTLVTVTQVGMPYDIAYI